MNIGDIFYWNTTNVVGYDDRNKYHIFIKESDWKTDNVFMYINKANYGGDYLITNPPYQFLTLPFSYVGCTGVITYTDSELSQFSDVSVGTLKKSCWIKVLNLVQVNRIIPRGD